LDLGTIDSPQEITLEAWFKILPSVDEGLPPTSFPRIFHYNNFDMGQYAFGLVGNDSAGFEQRSVWAGRGTGADGGGVILSAPADSVTPSDDERWFHLVAHLQSDNIRLFLNGDELTDLTDSDPIAWQAEQATIGARLQSDEVTLAQSFPGLIDELAVYNTLLSPDRIKAHYQAGLGQLVEVNIDTLQDAIKAGSNDPTFDLNQDGMVNLADQTVFIRDIRKTWTGDANFDGQFNSGDFVQVFQIGEYEDNNPANPATIMNSKWNEGDWNADREFDSSDFVIAFQEGGYEKGPRPGVAAVPEPSGMLLLLVGGLFGFGRLAVCRSAGKRDRSAK
jgi:hypothetical protein